VDVRAGSRDDDLLGAAGDVLASVSSVGETTGRLDDDVDAQVAPGEVGGIALFEDLDGLATDGDRVTRVRDLDAQGAADGVVLQEVRESRVIGEVVDCNDLDVSVLCESRTKEITSDTTEAVDTDLDRH